MIMRTLPVYAGWLLLALMPAASAQELRAAASEQTIFLWRVLAEPLVPSAGDHAEERTRLVQALNRFAARSEPDDFSALAVTPAAVSRHQKANASLF